MATLTVNNENWMTSTDLLWGSHASTLKATSDEYIVRLTTGEAVRYLRQPGGSAFTYTGSPGNELPVSGNYDRVQSGFWSLANVFSVNTTLTIAIGYNLANVFSPGRQELVLGGNDSFQAADAGNVLRGYGGDDTFNLDASDTGVFSIFDGGTGHDSIIFASDQTLANVLSVEELVFNGSAGFLTIHASTIGPSELSSALQVTARAAAADQITVLMNDEMLLDLSGFTFSGWTSSDTLTITGDGDAELITGSTQADIINGNGGGDSIQGGAGADQIFGGDGNDTLVFTTGDVVSGENISGGTLPGDIDKIRLNGNVDFSPANSILAIDQLEYQNIGSSNVATFRADQIGGPGISGSLAVTGSALVDQLVVNLGAQSHLNLSSFTFNSWGANDIITINGDGDGENITGTTQADTIAGNGGIDVISGHDGNDAIYGGAGADSLTGGTGSDSFLVLAGDFASSESIDGSTGVGVDRIRLAGTSSFTAGTILSIEELEFTALAGASTATFNANQLGGAGLASNLGIIGNALTTDSLVFNMGSQATLDLAALSFTSWSATDTVTINGDPDAETITGSSQNDTLNGNLGDDTLTGGAADDMLNGGAHGSVGDTASYLGATGTGVTVSLAIAGAQTVGGGLGIDTLTGIENLDGSNLGDNLIGDGGNNRLQGFGGDDGLRGGAGDDTIDGGNNGTMGDTASYFFDATGTGVTVSLAIAGAQAVGGGLGTDSLIGIENLDGSNLGDNLTGNGGNNRLRGFDGSDNLRGGAGNDTLDGGAQSAGGADTANLSDATDSIVLTLDSSGNAVVTATGIGTETLIGIENIIGGIGNDILRGNDLTTGIDGGAGNDTIHSSSGGEKLVGGANTVGGDTVNLSAATSSIVMTLNAAGDTLVTATGIGADDLRGFENVVGGSAGDNITGNASANVLTGMGGNDTLDGGTGSDRLSGGAGDDTIYWDASDDPAFVLGGSNTDTLVVRNAAAPTSFGLAAHEFERATVITDDTGGNWWQQITDTYNASWQRTNSDTRADNGNLVQTTYDVSAGGTGVNWQYISDYRNAASVLTNQDGQFDNGGTFAKSFDYAAGTGTDGISDELAEFTYFFRNVTEQQQGKVLNVEGFYDDGRKFTQTNDVDANQAWTFQTDWYETDGVTLDFKEIRWDDGSTQIIPY